MVFIDLNSPCPKAPTPHHMICMESTRKTLTPEARRALAEAEERRKAAITERLPEEKNGRNGPEPTRYGDWESKGIASDF
jgi:hypothetical protein